MGVPDKTIAVINASGRQAASFIRVATAVGYKVRAQLRNLEGVVATEVGQVRPLEHKGADGREAVGCGAVVAAVAEDQVVIRDAGRCVEGVGEVVGEVDGLFKEDVDFVALFLSSAPTPV